MVVKTAATLAHQRAATRAAVMAAT
jgi:hypothetical protein